MQIREISIDTFNAYTLNHPLRNMCQTVDYALFMAENGFDYDLIGYVDEFDNVMATSVILHRKISFTIKYGYAPKGFLVDYYNRPFLTKFINDLKEYYRKKGFAFIKINPEIVIGEIDYKNDNIINYNQNRQISDTLVELGFSQLKRALNFESAFPSFNAILPLKNYTLEQISKPTRNKIRNSLRKGLKFSFGDRDSIDIIYKFIKRKKSHNSIYYKQMYNVFNKSNNADVFLVSINYQDYLASIKETYENELLRNTELNEQIKISANETLINKKMQSDRALQSYHQNLIEASHGMSESNQEIYIAGAIVIKHQNRVNIYISGYDKDFEKINPNYFLHYKILEYYKDTFDYIDLNGVSGNFEKNSKYYGLNKFKLGFKPKVYEFIGEFDLIINQLKYNRFLRSKRLINKYNKKSN